MDPQECVLGSEEVSLIQKSPGGYLSDTQLRNTQAQNVSVPSLWSEFQKFMKNQWGFFYSKQGKYESMPCWKCQELEFKVKIILLLNKIFANLEVKNASTFLDKI